MATLSTPPPRRGKRGFFRGKRRADDIAALGLPIKAQALLAHNVKQSAKIFAFADVVQFTFRALMQCHSFSPCL